MKLSFDRHIVGRPRYQPAPRWLRRQAPRTAAVSQPPHPPTRPSPAHTSLSAQVYDAWAKLQVPVTNKLLLRMHKGLTVRADRLSGSDNVTVRAYNQNASCSPSPPPSTVDAQKPNRTWNGG
jgi:hypothetical protein